MTTVLWPRPSEGFVRTRFVNEITDRALLYLRAGFAVHFSGPAGTGKTSLAFHMAAQLKRPTIVICGDDEFKTSDLVGGSHGYRRRKVIDNFIHSVLKVEDDLIQRWLDNRLTVACREGFTLVYDEFTRSRPEANSALLGVLEEEMLAVPSPDSNDGYVRVHPNFAAIFTSNPEEYAGVHKCPDALLDRMVTIELREFDEETETAIIAARAGLNRGRAQRLANLVRRVRHEIGEGKKPTVRAGIVIGKVLRLRGAMASADDPFFRRVSAEVILPQLHNLRSGDGRDGREATHLLERLLVECCPSDGSHIDWRKEEVPCLVTSAVPTT